MSGKERKKRGKQGEMPQRGALPPESGGRRVLRDGEAPARLPGESDHEYACFVVFWQKGAAMSGRAVAKEIGIPASTMRVMRSRRHWDARIQASIEEPPEVEKGWVERRERLREEEWSLHRECLAAGREALRKWQGSGERARLGEIVELLEFAGKLARLAAGMPDSHTAITGEDGEPIRLQFEAALAQAYGPVADVVAEVVDKAEGKARDDDDTGKITELRSEIAAMEGGEGGGSEVCGAPAGGLRVGEGERPDGGDVYDDQGAGGAEEEPGVSSMPQPVSGSASTAQEIDLLPLRGGGLPGMQH